MGLYLFYGQEEFSIEERINQLKEKFINPAFSVMSFKVLNNPDFYTLIEALSTQPFMFGDAILLINYEKYLMNDSDKNSLSDDEIERLSGILSDMSDNIHAIFCCRISRNDSKKPDSRKKIFKAISKYASVEEFPQYRSYDKQLVQWVQTRAKKKELSIGSSEAQFLIDSVGVSLRDLDTELEKLKIYKHPIKEITKGDVKNICAQTEDIFKLLDYYIEGRKDLAAEEFKKLNDRQNCLISLSTLQTNLRRAFAIKIDSRTMGAAQIGQKLKIHEYIVKLQLAKLQNITFNELVHLKNNLTKAEYQIKSGEITPPELAIETALLS